MKSQKNFYPKQFNTNFRVLKPVDPKNKARELQSLTVTHESVVATMNIVAEEDHRMIKIWWGDEGANTPPTIIDLGRERVIPSNNNLPRNTFRLQHRYDENAVSRKIILVQSIGFIGGGVGTAKRLVSTWDNRVIEIDPIYRFISYPIMLEIENHFDSYFENDSEFDINMMIDQNNNVLFEDHFNEVIDTKVDDYPIRYVVDGSRFNKDIPFSDEPIYINLKIKENDNWLKDFFEVLGSFPVEFDGSNRLASSFHPRDYTGSKDFRVPYDLNDGKLEVLLRTEMKLLVPLDKSTELLAQA